MCNNFKMSFKCCIPNCRKTRSDKTILHIFPNPNIDLNRFNRWINAVGREILAFDKKYVFTKFRVCHDHFEPQYYTRSKRLTHNAVPTLHLSGSLTNLFPNPEKQSEKFQPSLNFFGKKVDATNFKQYKKKGVCNIQFANEHKVRNDRLSAIAIPTLYLPGNNDNVMKTEMEKSNLSAETTVDSNNTTGNNANVIEVVEIDMDSCSDRGSTAMLFETDIKDNYQSTKSSTNISEHSCSMINKRKALQSEDDPVYNVTAKCNMCNVKIASQYNLYCSLCKHIFDLKCLNITNDTFKNLTKKEKFTWICPSCANQEYSLSNKEEGDFVSLHKSAKILDSEEETDILGIEKLKEDTQILKSEIKNFSSSLKKKTKEYDRLLRKKDMEICRLKEIVAELQNCIAKK